MFDQEIYETWKQSDADALAGLSDAELTDRFGSRLHFGTAGMRGVMAAGTNRMNERTVRQAARGIGAWLQASGGAPACAIAYDSRHNSKEYAEICACALAETGVTAWLYHTLAPTPMLSFAVRALKCGAGIVISASHNPPEYNGLKCYGPDGCQMTDEPAAVVYEKMLAQNLFAPSKLTLDEGLRSGAIRYIGQEVWEAYYQAVLGERLCGGAPVRAAGLKILYSPLYGTGNVPVREILRRIGADVAVTPAEELPNGDFPTCPTPNPENEAAFAESLREAEHGNYDLLIATDPDCDRLAVMVKRAEGGYEKLDGNTLGILLENFILHTRALNGSLPADGEVVRSIVTTPMADAIAKAYGCTAVLLLTGFKYIGAEILRLEQMGRADDFVFGFEESCGYLKGTYARDKDAVVTAMLVCQMASSCALDGLSLLDAREALYRRYGLYLSRVTSLTYHTDAERAQGEAFLRGLRENPPKTVGGVAVHGMTDYEAGLRNGTEPTNLPKSDVVELSLADAGSVIVRPSGTEPKLKLYYTVRAAGRPGAEALLRNISEELERPLRGINA